MYETITGLDYQVKLAHQFVSTQLLAKRLEPYIVNIAWREINIFIFRSSFFAFASFAPINSECKTCRNKTRITTYKG